MSIELALAPFAYLLPPIECRFLDGENSVWTRRYIERCQEKLTTFEGENPPYESYLKHEIATHVELLERFEKSQA